MKTNGSGINEEITIKDIPIDSFNSTVVKKDVSRTFNEFIKRFIDIVGALIGCILLIPITIGVYIARKILHEDDGPMFYEQLRIGKNGKTFRIYKFRTMVIGADEKLKKILEENEELRKEYEENRKLKNDPRITKIGAFLRKTSLDEWPQFINVLKGDMSLVGPRPYLINEKNDMGIYYSYIIKIKPGITGLWQVSGRSECTFKERLDLDLDYYKNMSLKQDAKILKDTVVKVFKREGAI